ncbi:Phospholipase A2 domain-containing protein [Strongyloides ratti]|uniref:Phospholipase A2 domain-containing protein n=1 Tax=Strongyloides ratti TaxID=34506 RepID=A0A090LUG0_STRRB|nr:Phospholipase A2 domain-containing protein [Strongyloides ratti]CEF71239.1 Phospholipase A2 domain-containing protein [Strongyloides ratti]
MSKTFTFIIICSLLYICKSFKCGSNKLEENIASSVVDLNCKGQKVLINKCCLQHDRCYDRQDLKKSCDDTFCECLAVASKGNNLCKTLGTSHMCNVVRLFGQTAYDQAKKGNTDKIKKTKKIKSNGGGKLEGNSSNQNKKSKGNKLQKIEKTLKKEETEEEELFNTTERL